MNKLTLVAELCGVSVMIRVQYVLNSCAAFTVNANSLGLPPFRHVANSLLPEFDAVVACGRSYKLFS